MRFLGVAEITLLTFLNISFSWHPCFIGRSYPIHVSRFHIVKPARRLKSMMKGRVGLQRRNL